MEEFFNMSNKELEKFNILTAVINKQINQIQAADFLNLSTRQIRNLLNQLNAFDPIGLISQKRGKVNNRKYKYQHKQKFLRIIQQRYEDFGPTFISEKLK